MSDILQMIREEGVIGEEHPRRLADLDSWSEEIALVSARRDGLVLTNEHWEVIRYLRERHRLFGPVTAARALSEDLDGRFKAKGGKRYLHGLFPGGPVTQGSRIAGLPIPSGSVDPAFGVAL